MSYFCIGERMSWASKRKTSRIEDVAYCLMGIFSVNMPLMYGEGDRAFARLQDEILKRSVDQSLFAWKVPANLGVAPNLYYGLLAPSPEYFQDLILDERPFSNQRSAKITGLGIEMTSELAPYGDGTGVYQAQIHCGESRLRSAIYLLHLAQSNGTSPGGDAPDSHSFFVRVKAEETARINLRVPRKNSFRQTIYIRSSMFDPPNRFTPKQSLLIRWSKRASDPTRIISKNKIYAESITHSQVPVSPIPGKLLGLYYRRQHRGYMVIVGLDWAGRPWCRVHLRPRTKTADEAFECFQPGDHENASHSLEDVRAKVRLRLYHNNLDLLVYVQEGKVRSVSPTTGIAYFGLGD